VGTVTDIYIEDRKWLQFPIAPFINIFPDKITRVAAIEYENGEFFTEIFVDDSKACLLRIQCASVTDAVALRDEFRKQKRKFSLKVVNNETSKTEDR
jgi:hypothetical protein